MNQPDSQDNFHPTRTSLSAIATDITALVMDEKGYVVIKESKNRVSPVAIAIEIAHEVDSNKYSPYTLSMLRLYGVLSFAYCCGCLNGLRM
jgi:hypothetical protein